MESAQTESGEKEQEHVMMMDGATEKNIPISVRLLIYFASSRLLLDWFASKALSCLVCMSAFYINNFTTLTLFANQSLPTLLLLIAIEAVLYGKWRSEKDNPKAFTYSLMIVLAVHYDLFPLELNPLCTFICLLIYFTSSPPVGSFAWMLGFPMICSVAWILFAGRPLPTLLVAIVCWEVLDGKWRSEKNVQKAFRTALAESFYGFIIATVWLAIVVALHRDSSPLVLKQFN